MPINYSKLRGLTTRKIIAALRSDGFSLLSQRGSHQRYHHPDGRRVTIPYHHPGDTYPLKTLKSILQDTEWTEEDLKRLGLLKG